MYDEISRVKKEKDRAKKRAYVRMVTNLGGSLNLELFCEKVSPIRASKRWSHSTLRPQKHATISSCLLGRVNMTLVRSIG